MRPGRGRQQAKGGGSACAATVVVTMTVGTPMLERARPRSPARIASSTRWVSTKWRYSRSIVASYTVAMPQPAAARKPASWTWMWSGWPRRMAELVVHHEDGDLLGATQDGRQATGLTRT